LIKLKRKKNKKDEEDDYDYEDINYEVFSTSDSLRVGMRLLVVYQVDKPDLTLAKLNPDQIVNHIENLVTADMGMVIQNCSSVDFLKTNQTQAKSREESKSMEFFEQLQDKIKNQLFDDFSQYGVKLIRLNIQTPKVMDKKVSSKMAEFSLLSSEARAKEANLERITNIVRQEANQDAIKKQISQEQENKNKISAAEANLQAAKLEASGKFELAQVDVKTQERLLDISNKRAELYEKFPNLFQYDLAKVQTEAMKGISTSVISPELASMWYNFVPVKTQTQQVVAAKKA